MYRPPERLGQQEYPYPVRDFLWSKPFVRSRHFDVVWMTSLLGTQVVCSVLEVWLRCNFDLYVLEAGGYPGSIGTGEASVMGFIASDACNL